MTSLPWMCSSHSFWGNKKKTAPDKGDKPLGQRKNPLKRRSQERRRSKQNDGDCSVHWI